MEEKVSFFVMRKCKFLNCFWFQEVPRANLIITSEVIAKGGSGELFKGYLDNTPVVIKTVDEWEAKTMEDLSNQPNILPYLMYKKEWNIIVLPMMAGSILDILWSLDERTALRILQQVSSALEVMHTHFGIAHLDLKPENILYEQGQQEFYLADFGTSFDVVPNGKEFGFSFGTPPYIAPELESNKFMAVLKSDLWALGLIAWELLHQTRFPFAENPFNWEYRYNLHPALVSLIEGCLQKDPDSRIDLKEFQRLLAVAISDLQ